MSGECGQAYGFGEVPDKPYLATLNEATPIPRSRVTGESFQAFWPI